MSREKNPLALLEVAVAVHAFGAFTYGAPAPLADLARPGHRVRVPFGRRVAIGFILGPGRPPGRHKIRNILDIIDDRPIFPPEMIPFFRWVADYYLYPLGAVIAGALPGGMAPAEKVGWAIAAEGRAAISDPATAPLRQAILALLLEGPLPIRQIRRRLGEPVPDGALRAMAKKGWVARLAEPPAEIGHRMLRHAALTEAGMAVFSGAGGAFSGMTEKARRVAELLMESGEMAVADLERAVPGARSAAQRMEKAGHVALADRPVHRDPFGEPVRPDHPPELTDAQRRAVERVADGLDAGFGVFVLAGVTGSGKTEVYLRLAQAVVDRGGQVLALVPEIALISQTARRFRARFGERVAILHSGLSAGERHDQWIRILKKEAVVAVGARSALFAPFDRPGLIIVDEEHDPSYKQGGDLLYNARDLAIVRARDAGCPCLLGSATPSVQTWEAVKSGRFHGIFLKGRVLDRPMPEIRIVDLREQTDRRGAFRVISPPLRDAMADTLGRGEQVLLFLNRRGFSTHPVCASCGEPIRCRDCDITLTLHRAARCYRCHYCGFSRPEGAGCPTCGGGAIKQLGFGTERVTAAAESLFPDARTVRMDRDTTRGGGAIVRMLKALRQGQIDVLVGTQMVTKGHDFPNITLVGVICADLSLNFPDFRAGERTFQLLAQVAGRAGRGEAPGQVILQTYNPSHYSIDAARRQDFEAFYIREIAHRQALGYPPFSRMIQIRFSGEDQNATAAFAASLGEKCRLMLENQPPDGYKITLLGPIEAMPARVAGRYGWQLVLKSPSPRRLRRFIHALRSDEAGFFNNRRIRVVVDVDPLSA